MPMFKSDAAGFLVGELVRSNADDGEWRAVEPGSLGAALLKFACGKK